MIELITSTAVVSLPNMSLVGFGSPANYLSDLSFLPSMGTEARDRMRLK